MTTDADFETDYCGICDAFLLPGEGPYCADCEHALEHYDDLAGE